MSQDLRLFRRLGALATAAIAVFCFYNLGIRAEEAGEIKKKMTVAQEYAEQGKLLKEKLSDDALWTDTKRKKELLGYLETVTVLRLSSVAPVLVGRISYEPATSVIERIRKRLQPLSMKYPAYRALKGIGMPSVPYLLEEFKKTNSKDKGTEDDMARNRDLLIFCVHGIYDQGKYGTALVKKRLELELAETKDEKEKANFQTVLGHLLFKEEKPVAKK